MDDRRLLDCCAPLPIACAWRRCRNASQFRDRHDAAYYLFEILLNYLAAVAIARYLAGKERNHRVNAALKGLARPSLGEWLKFLRECVASLAEACESKESRGAERLQLFNALRAFRAGSESAREQTSLVSLLDEIVAYRNRVLGHGALLESEHYGRFADLFARAFPEALQRAPLLTGLRLVRFDAISVEAGSRVECAVVELMGQHPIRSEKPHTVEYGQPAPVKGCLYLIDSVNTLLLLDPLLVAEKEDVYFLNEANGTIDYLSYTTGARQSLEERNAGRCKRCGSLLRGSRDEPFEPLQRERWRHDPLHRGLEYTKELRHLEPAERKRLAGEARAAAGRAPLVRTLEAMSLTLTALLVLFAPWNPWLPPPAASVIFLLALAGLLGLTGAVLIANRSEARRQLRQGLFAERIVPASCFLCRQNLAGVTATRCPRCGAMLLPEPTG